MGIVLRRWMYLDHEGIVSLRSQLGNDRVVERTQTLSDSASATHKGTAGVGAFLSRLEYAQERGSSQRAETFKRTAVDDEHMLIEIESYLASSDALEHVRSARDIAEIYARGQVQFVTGVLRFRWATSFDSDPVIDATRKEMVEFDLDRDAHDDAGMLAVPVRLGGGLAKCVSKKNLQDGSVSPTSHLAIFLRSIAHDALPLGFFAQLQPLSKLIYLKPYAIWFP